MVQGQARRSLVTRDVRATHVVFQPRSSRPLLLALAQLENTSEEPVWVEYTETWDVPSGTYRAAPGACERRTPDTIWALADASAGLRATPPDPPPRIGLALDVRLALPAGSRRELSFAYVRCTPPDEPAALVRAWRGDVARELTRVSRAK